MLGWVRHLYFGFHRAVLRWLLLQYGLNDKYINDVIKITERKEAAIAKVDQQFTILEKIWAERPPAIHQVKQPAVFVKKGYVYFIFNEASNAVKIGYSARPTERLAGLQTSNPQPLKLVATVVGDTTDERKYHERFAPYRLKGEWFTLHDELRSLITQLRKQERLAKKKTKSP